MAEVNNPTVDELIELIQHQSSPVLDFQKDRLRKKIQRLLTETKRDMISDFIIECYNHDDPTEIVKELKQERKRLEAQLHLTTKEES